MSETIQARGLIQCHMLTESTKNCCSESKVWTSMRAARKKRLVLLKTPEELWELNEKRKQRSLHKHLGGGTYFVYILTHTVKALKLLFLGLLKTGFKLLQVMYCVHNLHNSQQRLVVWKGLMNRIWRCLSLALCLMLRKQTLGEKKSLWEMSEFHGGKIPLSC